MDALARRRIKSMQYNTSLSGIASACILESTGPITKDSKKRLKRSKCGETSDVETASTSASLLCPKHPNAETTSTSFETQRVSTLTIQWLREFFLENKILIYSWLVRACFHTKPKQSSAIIVLFSRVRIHRVFDGRDGAGRLAKNFASRLMPSNKQVLPGTSLKEDRCSLIL